MNLLVGALLLMFGIMIAKHSTWGAICIFIGFLMMGGWMLLVLLWVRS